MLIISIVIFSLVLCCSSDLRDFVSIRQTRLPISNSIVTSLEPQGWMTRSMKATRSSIQEGKMAIREIIYIPCPISFGDENYGDDEHFCSYLCDKGYPVHVLVPLEISPTSYQKAIAEIVKWRMTLNVPARTLALVTNEIVSSWLLTYLNDIALPMTPLRQDVGAVVIIDPPPLISYLTSSGQNNVVKRYYNSYNDFGYYKNTMRSSSCTKKTEHDILSWKMYRKRIDNIVGLKEILDTSNSSPSVINEMNDTTNDAIDYSDDFRAFTGLIQDKEFDYDRAVFFATVGKKKKKKLTTRRLASSSISVKTTDTHTTKGKSQFVSSEVNTVGALLGSPPLGTKMISISETLKDRILVISTIKDNKNQSTNDASFNSDNSENDESDHYLEALFPMTDIDDWGYDSANEMATMYKAGPVISLENDNNDNDDNHDNDYSDDDDSNDDDSNDDVSSHKKLSDIVSDWLSMLTSFGYL